MRFPDHFPTLQHTTVLAVCDSEHVVLYDAFDRDVNEVAREVIDPIKPDEHKPSAHHGSVHGGPATKDIHGDEQIRHVGDALDELLHAKAKHAEFIYFFAPQHILHRIYDRLSPQHQGRIRKQFGLDVTKESPLELFGRIFEK
jgi:hypothetical protein